MATGGLSFPKMGTDGVGHRLVQRLGHSMHPVYPALTPLKGGHPAGSQLAGDTLTVLIHALTNLAPVILQYLSLIIILRSI